MTTDFSRQAGAQVETKPTSSEFGESYDHVVRDYRKALQRTQDALIFEGLSLCEAYIEGRARIAVEFRPGAAAETDRSNLVAVWDCQGDAGQPAASRSALGVEKVQSFDVHHGFRSDQDMVLVGDVKAVDAVKFIPVNLEWLYFFQNEFDDAFRRDCSLFLSMQVSFRVRPCVSKRELCESADAAAIGFDKSAVSVVKGSAEVVNGVPDDGRCVAGYASPERALIPSVRIGLGAKGFDVVHHVGPDNRFELLDVMVGPFYL